MMDMQSLSVQLYKLMFEYESLENAEAPGKDYLRRLNADLLSLLVRDNGVLQLLAKHESSVSVLNTEHGEVSQTDQSHSDADRQAHLPLN